MEFIFWIAVVTAIVCTLCGVISVQENSEETRRVLERRLSGLQGKVDSLVSKQEKQDKEVKEIRKELEPTEKARGVFEFRIFDWLGGSKKTSIGDRVEELSERFDRLEKYLGVKEATVAEKTEYKKIRSTKK